MEDTKRKTKKYFSFSMLKRFLLPVLIGSCSLLGYSQNNQVLTVTPKPYDRALRNPLMGFSSKDKNPLSTTSRTYIRWNEIENNESDDIEKILTWCNSQWSSLAATNRKTYPRVYLHWDGDQKYWPADMKTDDYTSAQFKQRVVRLIERLGIAWDNDPRVAWIEMGLIGKWGEHHSPSVSPEMQKILGDAFAKAFKNKKVSVRHIWETFNGYQFGEYWDSWAHHDQMYGHGNGTASLNKSKNLYLNNIVGGEAAYNWGNWKIQPGETPTMTVSKPEHRNFVINSIRWLHCTQLSWIADYQLADATAVAGGEEIQKAFGYRFVIKEARLSMADSLSVSFDVVNEGSAPFYYNWPVEVALLDSATLQPVWKSTFKSADIRKWHPGREWTAPDWIPVDGYQQFIVNSTWTKTGITGYKYPAVTNTVSEMFLVDAPKGNYVLSVAILDPAGNLPVARFANANYIRGGRSPLATINTRDNTCKSLPDNFPFSDPFTDNTLQYDPKFDISHLLPPKRMAFPGRSWKFPIEEVMAWQYDKSIRNNGNLFFALDTAKTIGIYGCNNSKGVNIRSYKDSISHKHSAQFSWNDTTKTFQKNGQWTEYSSDFTADDGYQLQIKTREKVDAQFRFTILSSKRDTIIHKNLSLLNDFYAIGQSINTISESKSNFGFYIPKGSYIIRFDWYSNVGEPGIFSSFKFVKSTFDITPPKWSFTTIGKIIKGTKIAVITNEDAKVYLVPAGTSRDSAHIVEKPYRL